MTQKVVKVGTSIAVVIPKKLAQSMRIKAGDSVTLAEDTKLGGIRIRPVTVISDREQRIAELTMSFIERYRGDLEALARQ